jgi:hypothetical protein
MNLSKYLCICLLTLLLVACAHKDEAINPKVIEAANTPLICESKESCDILWSKAQIWVSENAGYKIQIATDSIIETYSARDYSTGYSIRLTKTPKENGKYELKLNISCGPYPICGENQIYFQARFRRDMLGLQLY